jgi:hypothetical protein
MANARSLYVNRPVSYRKANRWLAARIVSITNADNVVLRPRGSSTSLNGGTAVARKGSASAAGAEVNTWRPY